MRIGGDAQLRHDAAQGVNSRLELLNDAAQLGGSIFALPVLPQAAAELRLQ